MKIKKNKLDEMQEQQLLTIERNGFWFVFWALLTAMIVQVIIGGEDKMRNIIGEWIVFMCVDIYILVACVRKGIWSRSIRPGRKSNLLSSSLAAVMCFILGFFSAYIKRQDMRGALGLGLFLAAIGFIATMLLTILVTAIFKKREYQLEHGEDNVK